MKTITRRVLALMAILMVASCTSRARTRVPESPPLDQARSEAPNGPKARIAVARFTDKTGLRLPNVKFGTGMKEMLSTALAATNRFIVVDATSLPTKEDLLEEQELGASGGEGQDVPIGTIESPELLVTGAVTQFEAGAEGRSGGLVTGALQVAGGLVKAVPVPGAGPLAGLVVGTAMQAAPDVVNSVAGGVRRARVAVDIRVIDVRTARLLSAITAEGTATNVHLGVAKAPLSWLGAYTNTPMEHAVRVAIDESVEAIAAQTPPEYFHSPPVAAADALPGRATSSEGRDGSP